MKSSSNNVIDITNETCANLNLNGDLNGYSALQTEHLVVSRTSISLRAHSLCIC
jgi:hypothetical protein